MVTERHTMQKKKENTTLRNSNAWAWILSDFAIRIMTWSPFFTLRRELQKENEGNVNRFIRMKRQSWLSVSMDTLNTNSSPVVRHKWRSCRITPSGNFESFRYKLCNSAKVPLAARNIKVNDLSRVASMIININSISNIERKRAIFRVASSSLLPLKYFIIDCAILPKFVTAVNFDKVHCYVTPSSQVCLALHSATCCTTCHVQPVIPRCNVYIIYII